MLTGLYMSYIRCNVYYVSDFFLPDDLLVWDVSVN